MLDKLRHRLHDYTSTHALHSRLSAAEQTRLSWARSIETFDDVPTIYKPFLEPLLATGCGFPYIVLTPTYEGFMHRATEKLVCVFDHEIYVLLRSGNIIEVQDYPLEGIGYVEVRTILLDSHIKISGLNRQGLPISTTIQFNTVTDYLFRPMLEKIRLAYVNVQEVATYSNVDQFDLWGRSNYKFTYFAKHSILRGEKMIHAILQPEIRVSILKILGKMYQRMLSPTHMSILTDREVILIREELRQSGEDRYGGIWDYIPLKKIGKLSLNEKDNNLLVLSIQMAGGESMECLYDASMKREIQQFLQKFREMTVSN